MKGEPLAVAWPLNIQPLGDAAVMMVLGESVELATNARVHVVAAAIRASAIPWVRDVVPAYAALAVHYEPLHVDYEEAKRTLYSLAAEVLAVGITHQTARHHVIPVRYDGPDLADVARLTGLSADEVVERHSATLYTVYMIGFVPGFAYLGELDPTLSLARRARPRAHVPAGSVAIAGRQSAIYPFDTPGGWHLIGHTDIRPFDALREPPALLASGDHVRFQALS